MKTIINQPDNPLLIYLLITLPMGTFIVQILSGFASAFIILNQYRIVKKEVDSKYSGDWKKYVKSFYQTAKKK